MTVCSVDRFIGWDARLPKEIDKKNGKVKGDNSAIVIAIGYSGVTVEKSRLFKIK